MKILAICGSLRKGSFNKGALNAAIEVAPEGVEVETFEIGNLPLFNQDFEKKMPKVALDFKEKIRKADAILFVTPEYNYSISGVLKNAIDWGSRPYGDSAWEGKPAAIMGVSSGGKGTVRAQMHLRQMFVFLNIFALNRPEVQINAMGKFDDKGNLIDTETKDRIKELLIALVDLTSKLKTSD